uniref:Probable GTP-binding protein EngB n=1 Tax=Fervidobacterium thailandense TaxID=1008305 RepID=A0A7C4RVX4_9BACT
MKVEDVRLEKVIARPGDRFPEPKAGEFPFVGRSNVGKSSLLNALLRKEVAFVSKNPGKTRSINYYLINHKFYFVDLPGYGYAKVSKKEREEWRKIIERYFRKRDWNIKAVFSLVDSRHELMDSDAQLLNWFQSLDIRPVVILTKIDKLSSTERNRQISYFEQILPQFGVEAWIPCSSITGENIDKIWALISEKLEVLR